MVSNPNINQNNVNLEELAHLKSLLQSIHGRIEKIENDVRGGSKPKELRMILMGPPGAGKLSQKKFNRGIKF